MELAALELHLSIATLLYSENYCLPTFPRISPAATTTGFQQQQQQQQQQLTVRVSHAAVVIGALHRSVFCNGLLSILTRSIVYKAAVLGILLYAVETWPIKQRELHSLEVFHHRCLRTILGISRAQQIAQHISTEDVRGKISMPVPLGDIISSRKLRWLGHLRRMCDSLLPKKKTSTTTWCQTSLVG